MMPKNHELSLTKNKINILLLEGIDIAAISTMKESGYIEITHELKALPESELIKKIKTAHIIGIRSKTQLNKKILQHAEKLISIGCFCIGTNQVDLDYAKELGIPVFNAPFANTRSVAELVIGHIIYLMRGIPEKNQLSHAGSWQKSAANSFEIRGKTLGIIGYGHIGSQLSVLAESLGLNVIFYDIAPKLALGNAKGVSSLDTLLQQADIISLHVPATNITKNILNKTNINKIKANSILINASRGSTVDLDALAENLKSGKILGAAIDVYPEEPAKLGDRFISPLQNLPNVVLTPHIGGSTIEAQVRIAQEVADKLIKYSDNGSTLGAVNFPEVSLPEQIDKAHRLLHIHQNQPGVISNINNIFESQNINILGQYLQTMGNLGYVVIDIDKNICPSESKKLLQLLKNVPGTIKARVLF